MYIYRYIWIGVVMLSACTPDKNDEKLLQEAAAIHNEAIQTAARLEDSLHILSADTTLQDSVKLYIEAIENWKADLVEVPGNETDHHDEFHHHHVPAENIPVTASEMMAIQQTLKARIDSIVSRWRQFRGN